LSNIGVDEDTAARQTGFGPREAQQKRLGHAGQRDAPPRFFRSETRRLAQKRLRKTTPR